MKRILITGGTGLLGSNLALHLRSNYEVYILSNKKKIHLPKTKTNTPKQSVEHIFSSFKIYFWFRSTTFSACFKFFHRWLVYFCPIRS